MTQYYREIANNITVILVNTGIQGLFQQLLSLDPRFRGDDKPALLTPFILSLSKDRQ